MESHSGHGHDYYTILEVDQSADTAAVTASYKRLAKLRHPDKNPENANATADFQKLHEAYTILKDEGKRLQYDRARCSKAGTSEWAAVRRSNSRKSKPQKSFYAFHVSENWAESSETPSSFAQQGSSEQVGPSATGEEQSVLEQKIRAMRKQIADHYVVIQGLEDKHKQLVAEIDAAWKSIHDLDGSVKQLEAEKQKLLSQASHSPQDRAAVENNKWFEDLFGPLPSSAQRASSSTMSKEAKVRLANLSESQLEISIALRTLQKELETTLEEARNLTDEIHDLTRQQTEKEQTLDELCSLLHSKAFNGGGTASKVANETNAWDGWNGWCAWDEKDANISFETKDEEEVEPWWANYKEPDEDYDGEMEEEAEEGRIDHDAFIFNRRAKEWSGHRVEHTEGEQGARLFSKGDTLGNADKHDSDDTEGTCRASHSPWWPEADRCEAATKARDEQEKAWRGAAWHGW